VPHEINLNIFEPVIEVVVNQAGYFGIARKRAYKQAERYLKNLGLWEKRLAAVRILSGRMKQRLMIDRA
jgi:ABC-2 type transport system ATP-binding protein